MCGHSDVAYIDAENMRLCRGNQFSAKFYGRQVSWRDTKLPKADTVTFLKNMKIFSWYSLCIGYMDGEVEIRDANDFHLVYKTGK